MKAEGVGARGRVGRSEHALAGTLLVALLFLRVAHVFRYPVNSDEPQHLHVVWGWVHGLLPYRDVFDNHTPLFHLLCAPLFATLGERPDVLLLMRLAMIPFSALALWSTYALGRALFSHRVGLWAAVLAGLFPGFFFCSVEFRPDTLWTALWLLALAVLIGGPLTPVRSFGAGLILGTALGVSLKTVLLLAALGPAALATGVLAVERGAQPALGRLGACTALALVGLALVPLALTLFFTVHRAFAPFFYGVVEHNILPGSGLWDGRPARLLPLLATLPFLRWGARSFTTPATNTDTAARRAVVFLAAGMYFVMLYSFLPQRHRQDWLPLYPLLFIWITATILTLSHGLARQSGGRLLPRAFPVVLVPTLVAVGEIAALVGGGHLWHDETHPATDLLADVLRLTQASDLIMDLKGETVFRRRPFYYPLEGITRERIERGLIVDTIPESLVATATCVAADVPHFYFLPRAATFLRQNYLPVGRLSVAGRLLTAPGSDESSNVLSFEVQIPARYVIVAEKGEAAGWLDGTLYTGARVLAAGPHDFRPSAGGGRFAFVWAQAVERGFSPFASVDRGGAHKY